MNKITHEIMDLVNILIEFHNNIPQLLKTFPDSKEDISLLDSYVNYKIKKTLKDIIHMERL